MELFKKMGPRVVLIEYRGRLTGLVTVKDCLKYQFKVEAGQGGASAAGDGDEGMERVFGWLKWVVGWVDGWVGLGRRRGEVRLVSPVVGEVGRREAEGEGFAVGDDDDDDNNGDDEDVRGEAGVELEDRRGIR